MMRIFVPFITRLLLGTGASAFLMATQMTVRAQTTNTATGEGALFSNTTGFANTANGYSALFSNTTGSSNTADGASALYNNTTASYNTASGASALYSNTTGDHNTAIGTYALFYNTIGAFNTAVGFNALDSNTTGSFNTATGVGALSLNTAGYSNMASGYEALFYNSTGNFNTAIGTNSLYRNTTGTRNIALGYGAGYYISVGSNNIHIGNSGSSSDSRVIRIGTAGGQIRTFIAGISGSTASGGVQVFINSSGQLGTLTFSKRFKQDIHTLDSISNKLLKLRPVSFRYRQAAEDGTHPVQYGLIAEEVARVFPQLIEYDKQGKPFTIYYHLLTPLLLSELQKEHQQNVSQQAELASLKKRDMQQRAELASLKQQFVAQQQQQQQQAAQMAALQLKLRRLDLFVQAANLDVRLSQK